MKRFPSILNRKLIIWEGGKRKQSENMRSRHNSGSWDFEKKTPKQNILLMVQKSGVHQLRLVKFPMICRVLAPSFRWWLALGLPSTVQLRSRSEVQPQRENMDQDLLRVVKALEQVQRMSHTFPQKTPKLTIKETHEHRPYPTRKRVFQLSIFRRFYVFRGRHA